ncbi:glutathione S-transferase family protein [Solirhodobacter olei]|uniref:glutathione S-transferase family protein n=1 Tax=Solirhodobacter olei TaxID=2493082 RepID=UPI000FDCC05C|nr:glutathione S-transferase family protein [Solirhodobacter olei]
MITLYHSPFSRSSRIVTLIDELGALDRVRIRDVTIRRAIPPSGERDPANPHPEGKVPLLVDGPALIRESTAILLYLTEKFPEAKLGAAPGTAERGRFLSWIAYYGSVVEPVVIFDRMEITHPFLRDSYRGMHEVLESFARALDAGPYLLGERFTAVDLLMSSTFAWYPDGLPDLKSIQDWHARCQARPAVARTVARDRAAMEAMAA